MILRIPHHVHEFGTKILQNIFSEAAAKQAAQVSFSTSYTIGTNNNVIGDKENGVIHCIPDFMISLGPDKTLVYGEVIFTHKGAKIEQIYRERIEEPTVVAVIVLKLEETRQYTAPKKQWTKADDVPQNLWEEYRLTGVAIANATAQMEPFMNPIKRCIVSIYLRQDDDNSNSDNDKHSTFYEIEQVR